MTDKVPEPIWTVEFKGEPIAKLLYLHEMDWPWYKYKIEPLTENEAMISQMMEAVFYADHWNDLEYRYIPTGELAAIKALPAPGGRKEVHWFRGLHLKAPPKEDPSSKSWWRIWR